MLGQYIRLALGALITFAVAAFLMVAGFMVIAIAAVVLPFVFWWYRRRMLRMVKEGHVRANMFTQTTASDAGVTIIEGEYKEVREAPPSLNKGVLETKG